MSKKHMVVIGGEKYRPMGGEFEFVASGAQFPLVNRLLREGWRVVSVTPQNVSTSTGNVNECSDLEGKFLFVLEWGR